VIKSLEKVGLASDVVPVHPRRTPTASPIERR